MNGHALSSPEHKKLAAIAVTDDEDGVRLDRWFRRRFPALAHGQLQKMLRTGQIRVDGRRAEAATRLRAGQGVRVPPMLWRDDFAGEPDRGKRKPIRKSERLRDMVLFEDADVVALNKPAGMAVQGGTGLRENLDDSLMAFSRDGKTRPKLVHRLDRDTGGVLLVARNDFAAAKLTAAFRTREAKKIYWAVTVGVPRPLQGKIEAPLVKRGEKMFVADEDDEEAKSAATIYRVIDSAAGKAALVELRPLTGRTHQLRVHMAHLGTPILGDRLYGGENPESLPMAELGKGLHLHAVRLVLAHPRRGKIEVEAPLGKEMKSTFRWFGFDEKQEPGD